MVNLKEDEAYTAFYEWWQEALRLGKLYRRMGIELPPALDRALQQKQVDESAPPSP